MWNRFFVSVRFLKKKFDTIRSLVRFSLKKTRFGSDIIVIYDFM